MPKLLPAPTRRSAALALRRHSKIAKSAHAYVRGNTAQFYTWLTSDAVRGKLPKGPDVWICGDCHTGNLGPIAGDEGKLEIEIRDVDQTVIGNPAHDLLRLGLSLAMAARSSDLPGVTTALMIEEMITGYLARLRGRSPGISAPDINPIRRVMRMSAAPQWKHLAQERIEDATPKIPLGDKFRALTESERKHLKLLVEQVEFRQLVEGFHSNSSTHIELLDAAYWMKGCSSLGRLRYALLIGVGKKKLRRFHLLDVKEAVAAVAPRALGSKNISRSRGTIATPGLTQHRQTYGLGDMLMGEPVRRHQPRAMTKPAELYACIYAKEFPAQAMLRLRPELSDKPCVVMQGDPPLQTVRHGSEAIANGRTCSERSGRQLARP